MKILSVILISASFFMVSCAHHGKKDCKEKCEMKKKDCGEKCSLKDKKKKCCSKKS